jgi:hypothetical protein
MRIGLIPLDERPVNTRYPAMLARIAGVELHLPPLEWLSARRNPASYPALAGWLRDAAGRCDALIISAEMLGYGGLIASRTTSESAGQVIARFELLRELKHQHPSLPILGFNLITRISNSNNSTEEPDYWLEHGPQMYQLSQLLDRDGLGEPVATELAELRATIPEPHIHDFLQRRLRNHTVNLVLLQFLAEGVFDLLVLSSDDTSPYGLPSREKRWLSEWAERLKLEHRLLMYPGADEVGCVLLARLINQQAGFTPTFQPVYAVPGGQDVGAAFEDGPVRITLERQIKAVGGTLTAEEADFWLAINPPLASAGAWPRSYTEAEQRERLPHLEALVQQMQLRLAAGQAVIVADVAHANGADQALFELLKQRINLTKLTAYGGWNTAGNTLGLALAQACAGHELKTEAQRQAQEQFLLQRYLEDWGYQAVVRFQLGDWLEACSGQREITGATHATAPGWIETRLQALLAELPGFAGRYRLVPGRVRLPWGRTFEVDFELERVG